MQRGCCKGAWARRREVAPVWVDLLRWGLSEALRPQAAALGDSTSWSSVSM